MSAEENLQKRVDGQIVACTIDELIDETHSIGLFAKANYDFDSVNQFAHWYGAKVILTYLLIL